MQEFQYLKSYGKREITGTGIPALRSLITPAIISWKLFCVFEIVFSTVPEINTDIDHCAIPDLDVPEEEVAHALAPVLVDEVAEVTHPVRARVDLKAAAGHHVAVGLVETVGLEA